MEKRFTFDRRLLSQNGEVVKPLEVMMILPEEISEYLKRFGSKFDKEYLDNVIDEFKTHFLNHKFYKEPSFESEEINALELVACEIRRSESNPFLTEEQNVSVELEPKYKPNWVPDSKKSSTGFSNYVLTLEFCNFDPDTTFATNAYNYIG